MEIPELQQRNWVVTVVEEPSVNNAFVLPVSHLSYLIFSLSNTMFTQACHNGLYNTAGSKFDVFCMQTGHIFIFTGILNVCTNDDQLCVILAHEISHVLLSHMVSYVIPQEFVCIEFCFWVINNGKL